MDRGDAGDGRTAVSRSSGARIVTDCYWSKAVIGSFQLQEHMTILAGTTKKRVIVILIVTTFVFFLSVVSIFLFTCTTCSQTAWAPAFLGAFSVSLFAVGWVAGAIGVVGSLSNGVVLALPFLFSSERIRGAPKKVVRGIIWFAAGLVLCSPLTYFISVVD